MESPQVCAHSDQEPPRGLHWEENDLPPSLLPFHWSCSADSSHASVTNAFALGMRAQLSPKSTISYSFSKAFQRKGKGRRGIVNVGSRDQKIPTEFHRTKKKHFYRFGILSLTSFKGQLQTFSHQSFPTTIIRWKKEYFSAWKVLDNLSRGVIAANPYNTEHKHTNISLVKLSF